MGLARDFFHDHLGRPAADFTAAAPNQRGVGDTAIGVMRHRNGASGRSGERVTV
jgi:hypothetical protein